MLQAHPEPLLPQLQKQRFLLEVLEKPALGAAALLGWGCSGVLSADTDSSPEDPPSRQLGWVGGGPERGRGQRSRDESPFWSRPGCRAWRLQPRKPQVDAGRPAHQSAPHQSHPRAPPNTTLITPCLQHGPLRPAEGAGEKGVQRRFQGRLWGLGGGRPRSL